MTPGFRAALRGRPITWLLIALNLGYFAGMAAVDNRAFQSLGETSFLTQWGANVRGLTFAGEPWRLLSGIFVHAGLLHLGFNMLALFEIGSAVERRLGPRRMLVLYLLAGLGGSLASAWWHDVVAVGASGAIFGLLGVVVVFGFLGHPGLRTADGRPLSPWRALGVGAITAAMGLALPLDNAAHAGGFVAGMALALPALLAERAGSGHERPRGALVFGVGALALALAMGAYVWRAQETAAQATLRLRMAQLQQTLEIAGSDERSALQLCALMAVQSSAVGPNAAAPDAATLRSACDPFGASDSPLVDLQRAQADLRTAVEHNVRVLWPRCRRQATALLRHGAVDDNQRQVVQALARHCEARAAIDDWLFLDGPRPDLGALRQDVVYYQLMVQQVQPPPRYGAPQQPLLDTRGLTLPADLQALIGTYAVWNSAITADDRELARLDSCPYLSCRRSWARDLPHGIPIP